MNESPRRRIRRLLSTRPARPTRNPSPSVITRTVRSPVLIVVFTSGRCVQPNVSTGCQMSGRFTMSCCGAASRTTTSPTPTARPSEPHTSPTFTRASRSPGPRGLARAPGVAIKSGATVKGSAVTSVVRRNGRA